MSRFAKRKLIPERDYPLYLEYSVEMTDTPMLKWGTRTTWQRLKLWTWRRPFQIGLKQTSLPNPDYPPPGMCEICKPTRRILLRHDEYAARERLKFSEVFGPGG